MPPTSTSAYRPTPMPALSDLLAVLADAAWVAAEGAGSPGCESERYQRMQFVAHQVDDAMPGSVP